MEIFALIPARAGSKSVPNKNLVLLSGYPLIAYSILAAKKCKYIKRIIVSTDSEKIAQVARQFGAEVPFLRPVEISNDDSKDIDFVLHAIDWFEKNERILPDCFVHLRPTTPLRLPEIMNTAIKNFMESSDAESLRSAHPAPESPYKWFLLSQKIWFKAIRENDSNDFINSPRQEFPIVYVPNGYIDILKTSVVKKRKVLYGEKMLAFISPFCCEVDSPENLEYLEFEISKKGSILLSYLSQDFMSNVNLL
ncbi:MAG: acylneuraminate cytidylyltransferase family protein [Candidatus Riflebacteria bacterium]|nr:acylneuraminate cytidylyltransferase family protein [Candidatus Riflebacteria bacterium]